MNEVKNLLDYEHYLFVFAHPDDEIYTCVFITELVKRRKSVDVIYVTSGDYSGTEVATEREEELFISMETIGVKKENVHLLRVPERQLMQLALRVRDEVCTIAKQIKPDCIIGHDFEGGHNGHDLVSFFSFYVAQQLNTSLFVFPAYHGWPENRKWNKFAPDKLSDYELKLTNEQRQLQKVILKTHRTQENFINSLINSDDYALFSSREVLRSISGVIDYTTPPENPLGYEYPGSGIKFEDFKDVIKTVGTTAKI